MGIFKSQEQKISETREKYRASGAKTASIYHLTDFSDDEKILMGYINAYNFKGMSLIDLGSLMSGDDSAKLWNIQSLANAQFQQNWMIARILKDISNKLDTLIEKIDGDASTEATEE